MSMGGLLLVMGWLYRHGVSSPPPRGAALCMSRKHRPQRRVESMHSSHVHISWLQTKLLKHPPPQTTPRPTPRPIPRPILRPTPLSVPSLPHLAPPPPSSLPSSLPFTRALLTPMAQPQIQNPKPQGRKLSLASGLPSPQRKNFAVRRKREESRDGNFQKGAAPYRKKIIDSHDDINMGTRTRMRNQGEWRRNEAASPPSLRLDRPRT